MGRRVAKGEIGKVKMGDGRLRAKFEDRNSRIEKRKWKMERRGRRAKFETRKCKGEERKTPKQIPRRPKGGLCRDDKVKAMSRQPSSACGGLGITIPPWRNRLARPRGAWTCPARRLRRGKAVRPCSAAGAYSAASTRSSPAASAKARK